jgi:hypothetical protein
MPSHGYNSEMTMFDRQKTTQSNLRNEKPKRNSRVQVDSDFDATSNREGLRRRVVGQTESELSYDDRKGIDSEKISAKNMRPREKRNVSN